MEFTLTKDLHPKIKISPSKKPAVIAEAGVLTFGEKKEGYKFVDKAAEIGVKLLKFQCVTPENIVHPTDQHWLKRMKQRALSKKDFVDVMNYGKKKGVVVFASTHNEYDLIELSDSGMQILKIGSGDSNNFRMIDMALATKKTVILSLGLLPRQKIGRIIKKYYKFSKQLIIMHCTTLYPTPASLANLKIVQELKEKYPLMHFGYSDHVVGYNVAVAGSAMPEVEILEKHICLPKHKVKPKFESWDTLVALTPDKFKKMLEGIDEVYQATRKVVINSSILEHKKWANKAVCARRDVEKGSEIAANDLMSIRPYSKKLGHVNIEDFYELINKKANRKIKRGEYIKLTFLK